MDSRLNVLRARLASSVKVLWVLCGMAAGSTGFFLACGGDSSPPPVGKMCIVNSECNNPLSCSFGTCHEACQETRDCSAGQRCVKDQLGVNVCQMESERRCDYNSDCPQPLVCAMDFQCRNMCRMDVDCSRGQTCLLPDGVCVDPQDIDPLTNRLKPGVPKSGGDGGIVPQGDGGMSQVSDAGPTTDGMVPVSMPDGGAVTPDAMSNAPVPVDAVTIDKPIMRQGELGGLITVTAPAGLSGANMPKIGDCNATVQAGGTDTMVQIRVSCPHGVAIGTKDLMFATGAGIVSKPAVLTVSAITAGPAGNDNNRGTSSEPFRTLKKALSVSDAGDTVALLDGEYTVDSGEDFKTPIPSKVTIVGQSAAGTKLTGPSDNAMTVYGIVPAVEDAEITVKNLTMGFFTHGVYATKNVKLTFENVKITRTRQYGVYLYAGTSIATVTFTGNESEISDTGSGALYSYTADFNFSWNGTGTLSSTSSNVLTFQGTKNQVTLTGPTVTTANNAQVVITMNSSATAEHKITIANAKINGAVYFYGKDKTEVTIKDTELTFSKTGNAIDFTGARLDLTNVKTQGGGVALDVRSGEVTVRNSTFQNYYYYGMRVYAAKKVDVGTDVTPGANAFASTGEYSAAYAIYDARPADPNPITMSESSIEGNAPPAGTYTGTLNTPKRWYIQTALNKIVVY